MHILGGNKTKSKAARNSERNSALHRRPSRSSCPPLSSKQEKERKINSGLQISVLSFGVFLGRTPLPCLAAQGGVKQFSRELICPNAKQLLSALVGLQQTLLENKRSHCDLQALPKEISHSKLGGEQYRPHLQPPQMVGGLTPQLPHNSKQSECRQRHRSGTASSHVLGAVNG